MGHKVDYSTRQAVTGADQLTPDGSRQLQRLMGKGMTQDQALSKINEIYTGKTKLGLFGRIAGKWVNGAQPADQTAVQPAAAPAPTPAATGVANPVSQNKASKRRRVPPGATTPGAAMPGVISALPGAAMPAPAPVSTAVSQPNMEVSQTPPIMEGAGGEQPIGLTFKPQPVRPLPRIMPRPPSNTGGTY